MVSRKDNRWQEDPFFPNFPSRRSYWWETRQNFPESQSLSKELLHFHDSGNKNFLSVLITVPHPAVEGSPHLLHRVPLNHRKTKHPYPRETFLHLYSQDNESPGSRMLPLAHLFFHMQGYASPSDDEITIRLSISYIMLTSPFCDFLPHLLRICVLFSVKFVPCGSTCCSGGGSGLRIQARASRSSADACAVGGTLVCLSRDPALASVCHHPAAGGAASPQRHKTEVRANCHH